MDRKFKIVDGKLQSEVTDLKEQLMNVIGEGETFRNSGVIQSLDDLSFVFQNALTLFLGDNEIKIREMSEHDAVEMINKFALEWHRYVNHIGLISMDIYLGIQINLKNKNGEDTFGQILYNENFKDID